MPRSGARIDRDLRGGAGVVDDVADPHHVAATPCTLARSTGAAMAVVFGSARAPRRSAGEQGGGEEERTQAIMAPPSAEHAGGGLHHLVGGADHLGVHLVGALGGDQVGDFEHDFDVGLFEVALLHVAEAVGIGEAVLRWAGGRRVGEQVVADRIGGRPC